MPQSLKYGTTIHFLLFKGIENHWKKITSYGETSPPNIFKLNHHAIHNIMGQKNNLYSFMKQSYKKLYVFYKSNHIRKSLSADFVVDMTMIMAHRQLDISSNH